MYDIQQNNTRRPANGGGVWSGSSAEQYFIFASDQSNELTIQLLEAHNIDYQPLRGAYVMKSTGEQVIEDSYIVNTRDIQEVQDLGLIDNQESLLMLSEGDFHNQGRRTASLLFNDGRKDELGLMTPVSEEVALAQDNWSLHINSNQYFIIESEA